MRALQRTFRRVRIDPKLQSNVKMPYGWTDYTHRVGSSFDCRSVAVAGLLAEGTSGHRVRQTCLLAVVDPMYAVTEIPPYEIHEPRMVSYKKWRRHQDTVCWFDLPTRPEEGLIFWQTISNAIILNDSMPRDCIVKVIKRKTHEVRYQKLDQSWKIRQRLSYVLTGSSNTSSQGDLMRVVKAQFRSVQGDPTQLLSLW